MKIAIATVNAREDSDEVSIKKTNIPFYDRERIIIILKYSNSKKENIPTWACRLKNGRRTVWQKQTFKTAKARGQK